jgi:acetyltransferase-like isoleucine patch superfamily enzyme
MQRSRIVRFASSVADPRAYLHLFRLVHYHNEHHVRQRRLLTLGEDVRISPEASFRNGQRISIGARTHVNPGCHLWAGDSSGAITIGEDCLLAPLVFVTASDYGLARDALVRTQPKVESDVVIGDDVWLGTHAIVVAGVRIGDGCVVGAGAVVTGDLPAHAIAAGVPARVVGERA